MKSHQRKKFPGNRHLKAQKDNTFHFMKVFILFISKTQKKNVTTLIKEAFHNTSQLQ